jgi:hypothetical protein
MSQLWGMLKNPALSVKSEIAGQIQLVPSSASRVRCVSDWYTAPLLVKDGSPRSEGTIGLTKPQCRLNPEKWPLPLPLTQYLISLSSFSIGIFTLKYETTTLLEISGTSHLVTWC